MKTLLFTLEYPPFKGGVANYYGNLAKYWPIGESISVLDNSRGQLSLDEKGFFSWWPSIFCLRRKIIGSKIDYVLVGHILPLGTVAYFWSLFMPFKYAVFLHGMDLAYTLKSPRKKWLATIILKRADKIICANSYVAEKAEELNSDLKEKIRLINPGIESGTPAPNPEITREIKNKYNLDDKIILFSLGRLVRRKGIDKTIKALTKIPAPLKEKLVYFIAGTGPKKDYLHQLIPGGFQDKIIFLGEISDEEKWVWLNLCDIFIMPSRDIKGDFEGFGIVYLEANLCGKPVIAGNSGGVRDAVINGYNGLIIDSEDINDIKRGIIKLADNPEQRRELGRQGKERAIAEFNWEKQIEKLFNFLRD